MFVRFVSFVVKFLVFCGSSLELYSAEAHFSRPEDVFHQRFVLGGEIR
jgi:hypothetical protein